MGICNSHYPPPLCIRYPSLFLLLSLRSLIDLSRFSLPFYIPSSLFLFPIFVRFGLVSLRFLSLPFNFFPFLVFLFFLSFRTLSHTKETVSPFRDKTIYIYESTEKTERWVGILATKEFKSRQITEIFIVTILLHKFTRKR